MESEVSAVLTTTIDNLPVSFQSVQEASKEDPIIMEVMRYHLSKWPATFSSTTMRELFKRRNELSIIDDVLLFGDRIVIPESLRHRILEQFHNGHPGMSRMKSLMRAYAYWPGMDDQIEHICRCCARCVSSQRMPPKLEPQSWPKPEGPWQRVHIDFAGPINGQSFLLVVDAFSKWPEVFPMQSTDTSSTINKLRHLFATFGVPETIISDNGTQFTSQLFREFTKRFGISHVNSPPFHPQSNGQAERFVDTFKRALLKSKGEKTTNEIIDTFLLNYRATPNPQCPESRSPAESLMKKKLRLPHDILRPTPRKQNILGEPRRSFKIGDRVLVRDYRRYNNNWITGIVHRRIGAVLYEVRVGPQLWRRHVNQLRRTLCDPVEVIETQLPLDNLLDTFNIPQHRDEPTFPTTVNPDDHSTQSRRLTNRIGRKKKFIQVDPKQKSYQAY